MKNTTLAKHVLLVVPYSKPDYSGSGINAFNFARFLNGENHKATLLTFNRNLRYKSREMVEGVPIRRISYFNRNITLKILSLFLIIPSFLVRVLQNQVIIIYGGHVIGYQLIILFGKMAHKKVVFQPLLLGADDIETLHGSTPTLFKTAFRRSFNRLSMYHAINPVFATKFTSIIKKDIPILVYPQGTDIHYHYPVNANEKQSIRKQYSIPDSCFVIVSVGFVIARKRFDEIFRVLGQMKFDFRYFVIGEYHFERHHFLYGKRDDADRIYSEGQRLLGEKVIFTGPVESPSNYLNMADLAIFNSRQEGLSNALLEAMACGCPVLCRDIPGLRDYMVKHLENGILFKTTEEMRDWITGLHENRDQRIGLGQNAAEFIREQASFESAWRNICMKINLSNNGRG